MIKQLRRILILVITVALVTSSLTIANVSAYYTVGALGRSLDVAGNFTINRTLLAPLAPSGVEGCREGQLLHDFAGVTIHETSNWSSNANALMHAQYLRGGGQIYDVSWHYAVDSTSAYQSIPEYEKAWHAGDTANGKGNAQTIAIEICDNASGSFDQAMANAEWLAADVLYRHGVYSVSGYLFQHNVFSAYGKNCPITIRDTGRWGEFCSKTQGFLNAMVNQKGTYTPILMTPTATSNQAKNWAVSNNATAEFVALADIYWELAPLSGVDPTAVYAQSAHETGFGRFGGVIDASYFNPCGMKTAAGGDNYDPGAHQRFSSWREGVQAHIDHLALYAGQLGYPKSASSDPRQFSFLFGIAPGVENLSGKWAPSSTYGAILISYMIQIKAAAKLPYDAVISGVNTISYSGGIITAVVTVKNTGFTPWTALGNFRLGVTNNDVDYDRIYLPEGVTVAPGATYAFAYTGVTPASGGLSFRMVQDGVTWFGQTGSIDAFDAAIVSASTPTDVLVGQTADIRITVKNTGLATWTEQNSFRLGVTYYGVDYDRVCLPAGVTVTPGSSYVFTYAQSAQTVGNFALSFQMLKEGSTRFGESATVPVCVKNAASAEISSITLKDMQTAGNRYTVDIVVKNTDTVVWTKKNQIRLGVTNNGVDYDRIYLPEGAAVAPGASYTFTYTGVTPASGGLSFRMVQDGVTWFGQTGSIDAFDAAIVSASTPTDVLVGQTADIRITVKNTGLATWTEQNSFRLGVTYYGVDYDRVCLPAGVTVTPGSSYVFTYVQSALKAGNFPLSFQMLQEGVTRFGESAMVPVCVKNAASAEISSITLKDMQTAENTYTADIVVKNTDTVVWTEKNQIRLGVTNNGVDYDRIYLPEGVTVAPGASYTFTYTGVTPASGGLSFRMVQDGVTWFGQTGSIDAFDAAIVSASTPTDVLVGQTADIRITVKNTGLATWTEQNSFRLGITCSGVDYDRVCLPAGVTVSPGSSYVFTYVQSALKVGNFPLSFQMLQEGVTRFGQAVSLPNFVKLN